MFEYFKIFLLIHEQQDDVCNFFLEEQKFCLDYSPRKCTIFPSKSTFCSLRWNWFTFNLKCLQMTNKSSKHIVCGVRVKYQVWICPLLVWILPLLKVRVKSWRITWTTLMTKQSDIGRVTKCQDDEKGDKGDEVKMKSKSEKWRVKSKELKAK